MPFGQLVVGPPGSGKTTYCNGMQQFLSLLGRKTVIVNLDPANDSLPYECAVDLADLVSLEEVQNSIKLGPNGGALPAAFHWWHRNIPVAEDELAGWRRGRIAFCAVLVPKLQSCCDQHTRWLAGGGHRLQSSGARMPPSS